MSVVRVGATKQYSDNWDNIFSGGKRLSAAKKAAARPARKSAKKTTAVAKRSTGKKRPSGMKRKSK